MGDNGVPVATIVLWDHPFDVVSGIAAAIGQALRGLGFDVRYLNVLNAKMEVKSPAVLDALANPDIAGCEFALSVGAPPLAIKVDGRPLYEILGKQFFLFSLDSMFYDVSRVLGAAEFLATARTSPRLGILSPDRDGAEVINRPGRHEICTYLPFAGLLRPVTRADRLDRIAVIANIGTELAFIESSAITCEQLALEAPAALGVAAEDLVRFARELERPGFVPTIDKLASEFLCVPAATLHTVEVASYLSRLDAHQKWRRRRAAVAALRDVPVDFFGTGWERHTTGLPDCRHLGPVGYRQVPEICRRYRVVLNFDPNWGYGLHDRVFTALANGARVLTNTSRALADLRLPDPEAVLTYDANRPDMTEVAARALALPPLDPGGLHEFRSSNSWLARMDAFLAGPRGRSITESVTA